jgi:hypothetical protein
MTKRRSKRSAVRVPVSVSSCRRGQRAALTCNVSDGGFCLEGPTLLEPGSEISGWALDGDVELAWSGRIAWAEQGDPWHRMGVRFTSLSPGLGALLARPS